MGFRYYSDVELASAIEALTGRTIEPGSLADRALRDATAEQQRRQAPPGDEQSMAPPQVLP